MNEQIEENAVVEEGQDYIEAIKTLKSNTVPKEEAEKLKAENKRLLEALTNGETIEQSATKKEFNEEEVMSIITNPNSRDLDFFKSLISLREHKLETENIDIFAGKGTQYQPVPNESQKIENVVNCINHCIEYADGDPDAFDTELDRITIKNIKPKLKK